MPAVLIILGLFAGLIAAASAWLGAGASIWAAGGIYVLVGNAVCLASVGVVMSPAQRGTDDIAADAGAELARR